MSQVAPGPGEGERLRRAAAEMRRQGRLGEATRLLKRAVELAPRDPSGWTALIDCVLADRRAALALEIAGAGLRALPDDGGLLCARARVCQSLSQVEAARADFERALALDGGNVAARLGLALQAAEAGDWEGAEALAAPLSADQSGSLSARIALGRGEFETARARADRLLAVAGLSPEQVAETALLLGEALDGLGRAPEAFQAFSRGKSALRRLYAERAAGREREVDKLDRLAAWFQTDDPAMWREAAGGFGAQGPGVRAHVLLVGFPRSGTTLLEQALAGHPDLVALEEPPTFAEAYEEFLATPAGLARLSALTAAEAEYWRSVYWRVVGGHGADVAGKVFLDKAPAGTLYLPLVAKLFPEAKVLFAVRDPRDVVLSCFRQSFQINALTYAFTDLAETARCYAAAMELAAVYREALPIQPIEVRYERLVDDFASELGRIAGVLGLELAPAMLDVAATASRRVVRTPSAPQVRAGLNRRGLGRWRAYAAELAPVMPILAPWIERLGYGGAG